MSQLMIDLTPGHTSAAMLRNFAALLLAAAGTDVVAPSVPSGTAVPEIPAPPAPAPAAPAPIPPPPAAIIPPPPPAPETATTPTDASAASTAPSAPDANLPLDKRGYPFDARIHGGAGTINKSDGLWRTKRGVDNAVIEAVEDELRGKGYGVAVPPAPVIPPPPAPVIPPPPGAASPGIPPAPPVAPGLPAGDQVDQFRALMTLIGPHTGVDGKCRREIMAPIYERLLGKPGGLPDFHKTRERIPELLVEIKRLLGA